MFCRTAHKPIDVPLVVGLMALAVVACITPQASATINNAAFNLKISEKEVVLSDPQDVMMMKYAMWDIGYQRMICRNMPYLELANDPLSDAPITEFRMTIGDPRFNFGNDDLGEYAMLAKSTPGYDLTSSVANGGDELVLDIAGGLQPGDVLRFKIDIDVDEAYQDLFFAHPDYRTVLFDMNGVNVYDGGLIDFDTSDNAEASAVFSMSGMPSLTVGPSVFEDQIVIGPQAAYYNEIARSYGQMEGINTFQATARASEEVSAPEPSSIVLGCFALLGAVGVGIRTGRRRAV